MPKYANMEERFWEKVSPEPNSGCWLWIGNRQSQGYGMIRDPVTRKRLLAHRFSWRLFRKRDAGKFSVCHRCDNPCCVNPDHLFLGSHKENMTDAKIKGRMPRGERQGRSRLKSQDVFQIRRLSKRGFKGRDIAAMFDVNENTIYHILRGTTWGWLK